MYGTRASAGGPSSASISRMASRSARSLIRRHAIEHGLDLRARRRIEPGERSPAGGRQREQALTPIGFRRSRGHESASCQSTEQATQIPGVQPQLAAEHRGGDRCGVGDLVQDSALSQRERTEEPVPQYANLPGVEAVESPYGIDPRSATHRAGCVAALGRQQDRRRFGDGHTAGEGGRGGRRLHGHIVAIVKKKVANVNNQRWRD